MAGPPPASVETMLTRGMLPGHGVGITDDDTDGLAAFDGEALLLPEYDALAEDDGVTERPAVADGDGLAARESDTEHDDDASGLADGDGDTDDDAGDTDLDGDTDDDARDADRDGDTDDDARDADRDGLAAREGERLGERREPETEIEGMREGETDAVASGVPAPVCDAEARALKERDADTDGDADVEAETLAVAAGDSADGDGVVDGVTDDVGKRRVATLRL